MRSCFKLGWGLACSAAFLGAGDFERSRRITSVVRTDVRTGRLVRSSVVTSRGVGERVIAPQVVTPIVVAPVTPRFEDPDQARGPVTNVDQAVDRIAAHFSLPPTLIHSVIKVESNYNPMAISPKGAQGLMQLIPSTARRFGVENSFNPVQNIVGGARYLRYLVDLYKGNYGLALAAYNAGEGAVNRFGGVPPFRETQNYLILVAQRLGEAKQAEAAKLKEREKETKAVDASPVGGPNHIREVVETDGTVRYVSR